MAEKNIGKITQVISAVLDIKFPQGGLPEINDAIEITTKDGGILTVEVAPLALLPQDPPAEALRTSGSGLRYF